MRHGSQEKRVLEEEGVVGRVGCCLQVRQDEH